MASFRENGFDSTIERTLDMAYMPIFGEKHMRFYTLLAYVLMSWATAMQVDAPAKFSALLQKNRAKMNAKPLEVSSKAATAEAPSQDCPPGG
jgi:hypothetical protein